MAWRPHRRAPRRGPPRRGPARPRGHARPYAQGSEAPPYGVRGTTGAGGARGPPVDPVRIGPEAPTLPSETASGARCRTGPLTPAGAAAGVRGPTRRVCRRPWPCSWRPIPGLFSCARAGPWQPTERRRAASSGRTEGLAAGRGPLPARARRDQCDVHDTGTCTIQGRARYRDARPQRVFACMGSAPVPDSDAGAAPRVRATLPPRRQARPRGRRRRRRRWSRGGRRGGARRGGRRRRPPCAGRGVRESREQREQRAQSGEMRDKRREGRELYPRGRGVAGVWHAVARQDSDTN